MKLYLYNLISCNAIHKIVIIYSRVLSILEFLSPITNRPLCSFCKDVED